MQSLFSWESSCNWWPLPPLVLHLNLSVAHFHLDLSCASLSWCIWISVCASPSRCISISVAHLHLNLSCASPSWCIWISVAQLHLDLSCASSSQWILDLRCTSPSWCISVVHLHLHLSCASHHAYHHHHHQEHNQPATICLRLNHHHTFPIISTTILSITSIVTIILTFIVNIKVGVNILLKKMDVVPKSHAPPIVCERIIFNLPLVIWCQRCFENFGFLRHSWLFACVQT